MAETAVMIAILATAGVALVGLAYRRHGLPVRNIVDRAVAVPYTLLQTPRAAIARGCEQVVGWAGRTAGVVTDGGPVVLQAVSSVLLSSVFALVVWWAVVLDLEALVGAQNSRAVAQGLLVMVIAAGAVGGLALSDGLGFTNHLPYSARNRDNGNGAARAAVGVQTEPPAVRTRRWSLIGVGAGLLLVHLTFQLAGASARADASYRDEARLLETQGISCDGETVVPATTSAPLPLATAACSGLGTHHQTNQVSGGIAAIGIVALDALLASSVFNFAKLAAAGAAVLVTVPARLLRMLLGLPQIVLERLHMVLVAVLDLFRPDLAQADVASAAGNGGGPDPGAQPPPASPPAPAPGASGPTDVATPPRPADPPADGGSRPAFPRSGNATRAADQSVQFNRPPPRRPRRSDPLT